MVRLTQVFSLRVFWVLGSAVPIIGGCRSIVLVIVIVIVIVTVTVIVIVIVMVIVIVRVGVIAIVIVIAIILAIVIGVISQQPRDFSYIHL